VHYRTSETGAKAVVADIKSAGGEAALVKADLAQRSQRAGLMANAAKQFGPLTVLINNASIYEPDSAADLDESLWDAHFSVHAEAPVFLARDFAAQLPEGVDGNIINMIDERVLHLTPAYFSYTLSKATLHAATRLLAQSLAPRVRVNAIGPGPTLPDHGKTAADLKKATARLPLHRGATPNEIADAVLFILASPSMTGQMLALDGGRHLAWGETRGPTPRK
jgi:NAD(P)-dependent dehydrogenase (short-subunit alcohol dehydrogenase family)